MDCEDVLHFNGLNQVYREFIVIYSALSCPNKPLASSIIVNIIN